MDTSKKFNLSWKDFQNNASQIFGILRDEEDFSDVTLVSSDLQQVRAHKVVLSSCSPVLKELLKSNKHSHPMIYLRGVMSTNLKYVLDYIYRGEVSIYQEHLNDFLAIADDLKLKGLSNVEGDSEEKPDFQNHDRNDYGFLKTQTSNTVMENYEHDLAPLKDMGTSFSGDVTTGEETKEHENSDFETTIISMIEKVNDHWRCSVCGKDYTSKNKTSLKGHIEKYHTGGYTHTCNLCDNEFSSKGGLRTHRSRFHKRSC